ncbi:hypothetical protein F5148DRAFT_1266092 [Russula earlei]|uniref:Uncharacterized protein n=1 Tax=Russula earlei TaxID=71964 RepID=A0ACC0TRG3_9AGAM|nr:hypothetical protein F5148DRAFT_1266092 [Russula earlei]
MTHLTVHQASLSCFSHPLPSKDGTISFGDFCRKPESLSGVRVLLVLNSLIVQLVLNTTKLQPCGKNFCELWLGFAEKGLGMDAEVVNCTP